MRVCQPARVVQQVWDGAKWHLRIEADPDAQSLSVDFIADAGGRRQTRHRIKTGATTLAVYAYWRGTRLPTVPRIEAGQDAWYWGVPLPDGTYNTLIFLDPDAFRSAPGDTLSERFTGLIGRSDLMKECGSVELVAPARAIDATAYLSTDCAALTRIQIGDAAIAIDPISSSGVQKAIQTALSGAIVVNTLLRRPESADVALSFYRTQLAEASERHRRWAANHYRDVADRCDRPFWRERGVSLAAPEPPPLPVVDDHALITTPVELSPELKFVATPCLRGDFVSTASALHHPRLASPVVFLGGCELAPLLRELTPGKTPLQIAQSWSKCMPLASGLAIAGWLVNHGILVERSAGGMAS